MSAIRRFLNGEGGQDLVEWALLIAFVVLGSAGLMLAPGPSISRVWSNANTVLQGPQAAPPAAPVDGGGSGTGTGTGGDDGGDHDRDRDR